MVASTEPPSARGPRSIRQDIRRGLTIALGFSMLAFAIIAIGTVAGLLGAGKASDVSALLRGLPLIIAGYFAAGFLGGGALLGAPPPPPLRFWLGPAGGGFWNDKPRRCGALRPPGLRGFCGRHVCF